VIEPLDTNSAIWYNRPIMERFQRAKLERQVADIRRELWSWVDTYRMRGSHEFIFNYDQKQTLHHLERATYLEAVAEAAEGLENMLAKESVP
jgi:hypothetical protein